MVGSCAATAEQNPVTTRALCDVPAQAPKQPKASIPMPAQGPLLPAKPPHPQAATSRAHRKGDGCYLESLGNGAPAPAKEWAVGNGCEDLQMSNTSREAERVRNSLPSPDTLRSLPELLGSRGGSQ